VHYLFKNVVEVGSEARFGSQCSEERLDLNEERSRILLPKLEIHLTVEELYKRIHVPKYHLFLTSVGSNSDRPGSSCSTAIPRCAVIEPSLPGTEPMFASGTATNR
jgi:hypothetical protein